MKVLVNNMSITTAFDFKTGEWASDWPGRISQYDVVYESPLEDPMHHGIALGSGTVGAMMWTEPEKVIFSVNRCDLWDDASVLPVKNWRRGEEEKAGCLRHACRLIIDFHLPVFDREYLTAFSGRLSLADASAVIEAESPLGHIRLKAFIGRTDHTLHVDMDWSLADGLKPEVRLERFGSRTHSHWYCMLRRDPIQGLEGTATKVLNNTGLLTHELTTGTFACALAGEATGAPEIRHSRSVAMSCEGASCRIALAVTAPEAEDPSPKAADLTQNALARHASVYEAHADWWKKFWLTSFLDSGKPYLNALYHYWMYVLASSQGGEYPGRFINGLFGHNRDVQNWNYYFHWNQQELYWGLNAAGHSELCESYLNYRWRGKAEAEKDAETAFGVPGGIYVSDVCDRIGRNSVNEFYNRTPAGGVALDFWRHYCYTGDRTFLKEKAAPYMIGAARLTASLFQKEADGKYHARGGSCFEGMRPVDDSVTEIYTARTLLPRAIQAAELAGLPLPEKAQWTELLENMVSPTVIHASRERVEEKDGSYYVKSGPLAGTPLSDDLIPAVCTLPEDGHPLNLNELDHRNHLPFHTSWCSPVFPFGYVTLSDKESTLFKMMKTLASLWAPSQCGWDTLPITLARLGMGKELEEELNRYPGLWQRYDNGLGHYDPAGAGIDSESVWEDAEISIVSGKEDMNWKDEDDEVIRQPLAPYRHCGLEPSGVFTCAMNERLLQSFDDGLVWVAPAVTAEASVRFTLWAKQKIQVSAEVCQGKVLFVSLFAAGEDCSLRLKNPWAEGELEISLMAGERKNLFAPDTLPETVPEHPATNERFMQDPCSALRLGLPKRF